MVEEGLARILIPSQGVHGQGTSSVLSGAAHWHEVKWNAERFRLSGQRALRRLGGLGLPSTEFLSGPLDLSTPCP